MHERPFTAVPEPIALHRNMMATCSRLASSVGPQLGGGTRSEAARLLGASLQRRGVRSSRHSAQQIVSQAKRGLAELLSLGKK